ncbi:MAG: hypothetical protein KBC96_01210 [Armatimonadetes bacterium]|nr:hypothetical protein [Armatimonadota bacterium]
MRYPALIELQKEVVACRAAAIADASNECHAVTKYKCAGDCGPMITVPWADQIDYPVQVLTVGINPKWTDHPDEAQKRIPRGEIDGPKAFDKYKETILSGLPEGTGVAHVELVQCGSKYGRQANRVIGTCRKKFFDKVVAEVKPRVIVPIGKWACEHLYWYNTASGKSGRPCGSMRARHGTSDRACIAGHECAIVFVLQPSCGVSHEERRTARERIAQVFIG